MAKSHNLENLGHSVSVRSDGHATLDAEAMFRLSNRGLECVFCSLKGHDQLRRVDVVVQKVKPMSDNSAVFWSLSGIGTIGMAIGAAIKTFFDNYMSQRKEIGTETWKIRVSTLEKRLSEFYWPLYMCLQRDKLMWEKAFAFRPGSSKPNWARNLAEKDYLKFSLEVENDIIIPNHKSAVEIIRSKMHIANADEELKELLDRYVRHVDAYVCLRSARITGNDPVDVEEEYPNELLEAVKKRLLLYQKNYDDLLADKGVPDLRSLAF